MAPVPHPFDQLSLDEIARGRDIILKSRPGTVIQFREIMLWEPKKAELVPFLQAEHAGRLSASTPRPAREAEVMFDVVHPSGDHDIIQAVVDLTAGKEVSASMLPQGSHAPFLV